MAKPKTKTKPKSKKMPKQEFIRLFARRLGVSQEVALEIIFTLQDVILESLSKYNEVKLAELVWFENVEQKKATRILNGKEVETEAYTKIKATVTERFRKR